jgi:hypothetical protein
MHWEQGEQDPKTGDFKSWEVTTPPPPLVAGQFYRARASRSVSGFVVGSIKGADVCFQALPGKVVELSCPEGR